MMGFPWWLFWVTAITGLKGRSHVRGEEVTYDGRSLIINGQRSILFSGSIHYPRSTPEMWPSLISKAKEGGLDVIQTYVFWSIHELRPGQYDFSGRYDLVKFINEIKAQGLYVCLRIGPFIEAEWTYGGFPFWLHDIPDITFRSDNEPFKYYMQNFTTKIVNMMKSEGLYASQGGPIILSQIENEYQTIEGAFHEKGRSYINWAAKMAVQLQTGVPWLMCKQTDAPDPIINTCNGMRCGETFSGPNSPQKPLMWTENWTSFYQVYGGLPYIRSAQDIAFHVALFIAKNGSYVNYYMYHGGTNLGRTGSPYATTSYYDQAPIDEYGLLRQPKWGHLKELHSAIKTCSTTILEGKESSLVLGQLQEGFVYREDMGDCVAFLVNNDARNNATVQFENRSFELLPKSISILSGCEKIIFDTAKVDTKGNKRMMRPILKFDSVENWKVFKEVIPKSADSDLKFDGLVEQMNITKDKFDYLWYTAGFDNNLSCSEAQLHVESLGHVLHAFLNHNYIGAEHGSHNAKNMSMDRLIMLNDGPNSLSLLSVLTGRPFGVNVCVKDSGAFLERRFAGLTRVEITCNSQLYYNFTSDFTWEYQVGLVGEKLEIYKDGNLENVKWDEIGDSKNPPLTWYKTSFEEVDGDEPIALNLSSMGKGEAWVNGHSIGRYWVSFLNSKAVPSQSLYHVPRSFVKRSGNVLLMLEEYGGNPLLISLNKVSVSNHNQSLHSPQ